MLSRLLILPVLLVLRAQSEQCGAAVAGGNASASLKGRARPARTSPVLDDIVGLDDAKVVLREAVVLPATVASSVSSLFWRSNERSAALIAGASGLGKAAVVQAAAAAAGALILPILATEAVDGHFCTTAVAAAAADGGRSVVVLIELLELAPSASLAIRQCLKEIKGDNQASPPKVFIVATTNRDATSLTGAALAPFGYIARLGAPSQAERKQFLLVLLKEISRVDPQWASALGQAAVESLSSLTNQYSFAEIDLVVRRAFVRSTTNDGKRDPVALHHFEQIISELPPRAAEAFSEKGPIVPVVTSDPGSAADASSSSSSSSSEVSTTNADGAKKKDVKDPMDSIFGWCNFWLPPALHLPPVVWAMIIFGILAHFMARSTHQPYGNRRKRGGGASSLFGGGGGGGGAAAANPFGGGAGGGANPFGDLSDWYPGGGMPPGMPPGGMPPGMPPGGMPPGMPGEMPGGGGAFSNFAANMPGGMPGAGAPAPAAAARNAAASASGEEPRGASESTKRAESSATPSADAAPSHPSMPVPSAAPQEHAPAAGESNS